MNISALQTTPNQGKLTGLTVSLLLHGIILLIMFFVPLIVYPPMSESGMMINLGWAEVGEGDEISEAINPSTSVASQADISPSSSSPLPIVEDIAPITQDIEESAPLTKKLDPVQQKTETSTTALKKTMDKNALLTPTTPEKTQQTTTQTNTQTKTVDSKALFTGVKSDKNDPKNQGIAGGAGDQGVPTGDPSSNNYEGDVSYGKGNSGIGFDLSGRSMITKPSVKANTQETGIVVIQIKVNPQGKVISAQYTSKGSTTANTALISTSIEAAYKAVFSSKSDAPDEQVGKLTFRYTLN